MSVRIVLVRDTEFVRTLASARPIGDGSFNWTIPSDIAPGNNYRIRITINQTSPGRGDNSNANFAIRKPNVRP
jgi:hypothetical protein